MTTTDLTYALGFLLGGILIALICNLLLLSFSQTLGIRNKNDVVVRWSNQSKPSLGGVSFFVVFVFSAIAYEFSAIAYEAVMNQGSIFHDKHFIGVIIMHGWKTDLWSLTLIAMIGGVIGFLRYNIHPSRLFMGDAGSQFIGLFVAFFAVHYLWNAPSEVESPSWSAVILVLISFTPAAVDTLTVVINRLKKGQSPMVGGKDHTTHHLVYSGKSDFQVWLVFLLVGAISLGLSLLIIWHIRGGVVWPLPIFLIFFIVVFYFLYRNNIRLTEKK